jgi:Hemerythrin HHE cation binding domain
MIATQFLAPARAQPEPEDAIALLSTHHEAVRRMFAEYEAIRSAPVKRALVAEICTALSVHVQIKEEIFYPEVKSALRDSAPVREATAVGAGVKGLIAHLQGLEPHGASYDAKVRVLADFVRHRVQAERDDMFPRARASSADLIDLGARMAARKDDLLARAA